MLEQNHAESHMAGTAVAVVYLCILVLLEHSHAALDNAGTQHQPTQQTAPSYHPLRCCCIGRYHCCSPSQNAPLALHRGCHILLCVLRWVSLPWSPNLFE